MSKPINYRKCKTCGSFGHSEYKCPVRDLNLLQEMQYEALAKENVSLGLTPVLEAQIRALRASWLATAHSV